MYWKWWLGVVRCGANSAANFFNIRAGIWSGPVAFVGSRLFRSFSVPNMVTFISGMDWKLSFSGGNSSSVFSGVKTEKHCLFNISAFVLCIICLLNKCKKWQADVFLSFHLICVCCRTRVVSCFIIREVPLLNCLFWCSWYNSRICSVFGQFLLTRHSKWCFLDTASMPFCFLFVVYV